MIAALVVNRVTEDVEANLAAMLLHVDEAAAAGADLVLFPEAAATGLVNNDDPAHDLPLGQRVPGPRTEALAARARRHGLYVALGLLEREGDRLYHSAVLLDPRGGIALRYRRIQPQWHGRAADPFVYRQGSDVAVCGTPLGSFCFLICGDLFDDAIVARVRQQGPDWVLFPFARCFPTGADDERLWREGERQVYAERAVATGATVLMANYCAGPELAGGAFGGAMVVSPQGMVVAERPLHSPGLLVARLSPHAPEGPPSFA